MTDAVYSFLDKRNMLPSGVVPDEVSAVFLDHMHQALDGKVIDIPMFATNLTSEGEIEENKNVIVIDAGGTNYRCGLAAFHDGTCDISSYTECKMPGAAAPVPWEEFISFLVDTIEPFADKADSIGFCFSYSATITEDCDGIVESIDKEIKITGCKGKLVGQSINEELARRGLSKKRVIILNDTVAALLGTYSTLDKSLYSSFSGMICGTGFNICTSYKGMIFNTEAGFFRGVPQGSVDIMLDNASEFPGDKTIEKLTSGVYIGPICRQLIIEAADEGLISSETAGNVKEAHVFNGAHVSALACGVNYEELCKESDLDTVKEICDAMLLRSARCAASAVIAILELNKSGSGKPGCFCAEGSLIAKSDMFRKHLLETLDEYALGKCGLKYEIVVGKGTTLPGAAVAALLNS